MSPLVSILIPAFNSAKTIAETIRSALQQTWSPKEIIVVDDGSIDQTLVIAQQFASKQVLVTTQPNQTASVARNKAFSLCQGDYIQWLDADDLLAPDKVAKQMEAIDPRENKRMLLSGAWGSFVNRPNRVKFIPTPLWTDLHPIEWLLRKLEQNLFMQTGTWLVSRELTQAAGPWDVRLSLDDDGEYFCRVILASENIKFVPQAKMYYRRPGAANLSYVGRSNKKLDAQWLSMILHIRYLRSLEDTERVKSACIAFLQRWLIHFYPERPDLVQQAQELAADLGGPLKTPRLPWKYAWIQKVFGWSAAKRAQQDYNEGKSTIINWWDKALSQWQQ